jgi:hypothetical protein
VITTHLFCPFHHKSNIMNFWLYIQRYTDSWLWLRSNASNLFTLQVHIYTSRKAIRQPLPSFRCNTLFCYVPSWKCIKADNQGSQSVCWALLCSFKAASYTDWKFRNHIDEHLNSCLIGIDICLGTSLCTQRPNTLGNTVGAFPMGHIFFCKVFLELWFVLSRQIHIQMWTILMTTSYCNLVSTRSREPEIQRVYVLNADLILPRHYVTSGGFRNLTRSLRAKTQVV